MMLKTLIPLALAVVALNRCCDAQSADTQGNAQADAETVAQLAIAAASEVSASSTNLTSAYGTAQWTAFAKMWPAIYGRPTPYPSCRLT